MGSLTRAISGRGLSTVSAEYRVFQFQSLLTTTEEAALRTATSPGLFVVCSGDLLPASGTYVVTIRESGYVPTGTSTFMRAPALTLTQVVA